MRVWSWVWSGVVVVVLVCGRVGAQDAPNITTKDELLAASTTASGPVTLDGDYIVRGPIDISGDTGRENVVINGGTFTVTERITGADYSLKVNSMTVNDGVVTLRGEGANRAIHVTGDFIQTGGEVIATGRQSNGNAIMDVGDASTYRMSGGILRATGCSEFYANGVAMDYVVMTGGTMYLTGGGKDCASSGPEMTGEYANGMSISKDFHMQAGDMIATGGNGTQAAGIRNSGVLYVEGGTVVAQGSDTAKSLGFGIQTGHLNQSGGTLTAIGSDIDIVQGQVATLNVGLVVFDDIATTAGELTAIGGAGNQAFGMWIYDTASISRELGNTITLERRGEAASIWSDSALTITGTAVFKPVVDFAKHDDLASGLLLTDNQAVTIQSGRACRRCFPT